MLDKSINAALVEVRKQIVRGGLDGLAQVDDLLRLRGIDPDALVVRRKYRPRRGRIYLRVIVLDVLRHGPMTGRQVADIALARVPEVPPESLRPLVYSALTKMGTAGVLVRDQGRWRLVR